jgi:RNA polymerase subunit RPABC4/transcription elongation factor Spt4
MSPETPVSGAYIPLSRAVICADCEVLYPCQSIRCPACGSEHGVPLAVWLGTAR